METNDNDNPNEKGVDGDKFTCPVCLSTFAKKCNLGKHMKRHSQNSQDQTSSRRSSRISIPNKELSDFVTTTSRKSRQSKSQIVDDQPIENHGIAAAPVTVGSHNNLGQNINVGENHNTKSKKKLVENPKKRVSLRSSLEACELNKSSPSSSSVDTVGKKRGRGRPKRSLVSDTPNVDEVVNNTPIITQLDINTKLFKGETSIEPNPDQTPKRRGRRRKLPVNDDVIAGISNAVSIGDLEDNYESSKLRTSSTNKTSVEMNGETRTNVNDNVENIKTDLLKNNSSVEQNPNQTAKRRGRRRKLPVNDDVIAGISNAVSIGDLEDNYESSKLRTTSTNKTSVDINGETRTNVNDNVENIKTDLLKNNSSVEQNPSQTAKRRGRRRKLSINDDVIAATPHEVSAGDLEDINESSKLKTTLTNRSSVEVNGETTANVNDNVEMISTEVNDNLKKKPKRPGRPRLASNTVNNKVEKIPPPEKKNSIKANLKLDKPIKCSCLMEFNTNNLFKNHVLRIHNGLAREFGDDRPFDDVEKKQALLESIRVIKKIHCKNEGCSKSFSCIGGYLYHEAVCGKTKSERYVNCDICGKNLVIASVKSHYKAFHEKKTVTLNPVEMADEHENDDSSKRKAAKRASEKLSKIISDGGCEAPARASDEEYDAMGDENESEYNNSDEDSERVRKPTKIIDEETLIEIWTVEYNRVRFTSCRNEGCRQMENSVKRMIEHNKVCRFKQRITYECTICGFRNVVKEATQKHVRDSHATNSMNNQDVDLSIFFNSIRAITGLLRIETFESRKPNHNYAHFIRKHLPDHLATSKKFIIDNFNKDGSNFPDWLPRTSYWNRLLPSEYEKFLPKLKSSAEFTVKLASDQLKQNVHRDTWYRLNLFESTSLNDENKVWKSCFVGGPVMALAWTPTSNVMNSHQFIAVYCHSDPDMNYTSQGNYSNSCLIQIWNLGDLESGDDIQPKFVLGIADNCGAVWQLRWCPSGCWDEANCNRENALPRIGLLAAACADGFVKIYSIPYPSTLEDGDCLPIYRVKPTVILALHSDRKVIPPIQCTALSWFEGAGHGLVAGGFTNGMISLWDLKTNSLIFEWKDEIKVISPFRTFNAHGNIVNGLDICPIHNGRFLVSCSRDRCVKFWDLDDIGLPINVIKKRSLNGVRWMPHYLGAFVYSDECYSMKFNGVALVDVTCSAEFPANIISHSGNVLGFSASYWSNTTVSCDDAGEVALAASTSTGNLNSVQTVGFKRVLLYHVEAERKEVEIPPNTEVNFSLEENSLDNTDLLEMDEDFSSKESENKFKYANAEKNYRLVYTLTPLGRSSSLPAYSLRVKSLMDYYCLNAINRISWNPNLGAHQWIACGEHNGLMRFLPISYLDCVPVNEIRNEIKQVR